MNALGLICEWIDVVEFLEPDGPITRFLGDRLAAIHHIAFSTSDLSGEMARLAAKGLRFTTARGAAGAGGK